MKPQTLRHRINRLLAFEQAIEHNILLSITNRDGIIMSANKKFCEISKYSEEELVGKNHDVINSGYHPRAFFDDIWHTILTGKTWNGEIKNKSKDGTYYWIDAVIVPVPDDKNYISEFFLLGVVISGSKEAEGALSDAAFIISHKIRQPFVNMQALLTFILLEDLPVAEIKSMAKIMQAELDKIDALTRQMAIDLHNYKTRLALNSSQLQP